MSDEHRWHTVTSVEVSLERQEAQHEVAGLADATDAALAPRPHLRAHVLHRAQPAALQLLFEAQVEVRHVDADQWRTITATMAAAFAAGQFEAGLNQAVDAVDALLKKHFPLAPGELVEFAATA